MSSQQTLPVDPATAALPPFARIDCTLLLAALQDEVRGLLDAPWYDHVNQRDYRGGWDVLPLRCQRQHVDAHPILQGFAITDGSDWQDLPVLDDCPAIRGLLAQLRCPLRAVRLMRLKAGAQIRPHFDHGLSLESGQARLHLSIQTSDSIEFLVEGRRVPMRAGELWYFNAERTHEVHNRGGADRINLVIDCVADDWLREQIAASASARR